MKPSTVLLMLPQDTDDMQEVEQLIYGLMDCGQAPSPADSWLWCAALSLLAKTRPGDAARTIAYALALEALAQHPPSAPHAWEVKAELAVRDLAEVRTPEAEQAS